MGNGACDKAAIIGLDGSIWISNVHAKRIRLSGEEARIVAKALKNMDTTGFQASGIRLEDVKYQFIRKDYQQAVLGKKKNMGAITLQKSQTAVVIGHTAEGQAQGNTNKAVAKIAEYLESLGY